MIFINNRKNIVSNFVVYDTAKFKQYTKKASYFYKILLYFLSKNNFFVKKTEITVKCMKQIFF